MYGYVCLCYFLFLSPALSVRLSHLVSFSEKKGKKCISCHIFLYNHFVFFKLKSTNVNYIFKGFLMSTGCTHSLFFSCLLSLCSLSSTTLNVDYRR
jgi:hypothetical protein